ncbi:hypothetical protein [Fulvivirga sedimenti]|uniref:Tetratricopeptide repeat protein n=1 Tax=Fulvivirga sedimenti TaxID=2879465 RepID=A0A9X1HXL3_9BACT|nr:hypothetical protein [Fulvivirga sedimenti]MCA6078612.1 hypothetical protein [Fulvivirga sedimenti]
MFTTEFTNEIYNKSHEGQLQECLAMLETARANIDPRFNPTEAEIEHQILSFRAYVYWENKKWLEASEDYRQLCESCSMQDPFLIWFYSMWGRTTFNDSRSAEAVKIFKQGIDIWLNYEKRPTDGLTIFYEYKKLKSELGESIEEEYRPSISQISSYYSHRLEDDQNLSEAIDVLKNLSQRDNRRYGDFILRFNQGSIDEAAKAELRDDIKEFLNTVRTPNLREAALDLLGRLSE